MSLDRVVQVPQKATLDGVRIEVQFSNVDTEWQAPEDFPPSDNPTVVTTNSEPEDRYTYVVD